MLKQGVQENESRDQLRDRRLHSIGIYYPDKPSSEYQAKTKTFIEALALMYPCVHCAGDFQKEIAKSPPRTWRNGGENESRRAGAKGDEDSAQEALGFFALN
ncbi:hypothetical protein PsorP6_012790 [Peronosclerospora sorghi]|uniref:Uncharacterized protein n=1 Tax=Peronosclerospora sorghi TaxID=230839 RepID=A0ACC0WH89_9STRA|nr:hypothetical protein PsorP6_012790 [Peronosclerospora sorghi]